MTKTIRVLHLSTHDEDCGVGKYQEMFLETMEELENVHNKFFDLSPNQIKHMRGEELNNAIKKLKRELKQYDILHIQHEFSFFFQNEFKLICEAGKSLNKKVIVTVHSSPYVAYAPPRLQGLGPRSFADYARAHRRKHRFFKNFISPIKSVDMIIAHNKITVDSLVELGIERRIIKDLIIPVPQLDHSKKSDEIKTALSKKPDDIIYCTIGFLHQFKGIKEAVKALKYLPGNYKLAIIGGVHPQADNEKIYDEISDLILKLDLVERVYITGFVEDDDSMNALVRECDISVYPYDKVYYSHVSSASLNNAFANHLPVVAYPTGSFKELNLVMGQIALTPSCSYYEMARTLKSIDLDKYKQLSKRFAEDLSYKNVSPRIRAYYEEVLA